MMYIFSRSDSELIRSTRFTDAMEGGETRPGVERLEDG